MEDNKNSSRRKLIKAGLVTGVAAATGFIALDVLSENNKNKTGEKVQLLSPDGNIVEVDKSALNDCVIPSIDPEIRRGVPNRKFVMVIDLARCANARKCIDGCQKMHHLMTQKEWIKTKEMQDNEKSAPYWMPQPCMQCDNPPCTKVCPVDATFKREDGIVLIDNERCIGCRFCMAACPYSARTFNWKKPEIPDELANVPYSPENSFPPKIGTVEKCDFCPHMARAGKLPACVTSCPNGVISFGDENEDAVSNGDETFRLSELLKKRGAYRLMEELGTKPRVYYLPPVNRIFPFEKDTVQHNTIDYTID